MSYGGGGNYNNNPAMYGGGGSSGANYYDPQASFSNNQGGGGGYSGGGSGYGGGAPGGYGGGAPGGYGGGAPGGYGGGAPGGYGTEDFNQALSHAQDDGGTDESDKSIFSKALDFIGKNKEKFSSKDDDDDVDENQAINAHQSLYGSGGSSGEKFDERSLGAGAAMQALKMFSSGQGSSGSSGSSSSGGHDQNKLIGIAMAQAGKLWDQQNQQGKVVCLPTSL